MRISPSVDGQLVELAFINHLLQIEAAQLLQNRADVITNWGSYYKLGQPLLKIGAAITNWSNFYYKLGQLLQIVAIIMNWGITNIHLQPVL